MNRTIRVELVWRKPAPRLGEVRGALRGALQASGLPPHWQEWRGDDRTLPAYLKHASPLALFINGRLAADFREPENLEAAALSRLLDEYGSEPFKPRIREPLGRRLGLSVLPALSLILLPKCPLCWAAYAGVASSLGIAAVPYQPWLLPALGGLTLLSLASMVCGARARNGLRPALLALAGLALVLAGKFVLEAPALLLAGLVMFAAAAAWNALPARSRPLPSF